MVCGNLRELVAYEGSVVPLPVQDMSGLISEKKLTMSDTNVIVQSDGEAALDNEGKKPVKKVREFHSYDEMSPEDFRALQMIELKMLLYFDAFCKEYNLRYYMAGGTLIGAVRHKGFIPWDEDIDVHMPRPDYEKLPELWAKYADTEHYTLCITDKYKNYRHHVYSICDNHTTMIEKRTIHDDIAQGIRMDILPFDGVPDNRLKAAIQFVWAMLFNVYNVQRLPENQGGAIMRLGVRILLGAIRSPGVRYAVFMYAKKQMSRYDFETSPWVKELSAPLRSMKFRYPRKHFDEPLMLEFEGHMLPAQHYYKQYLEQVYPGYMQLPPEDQRKQKTHPLYINLDEGYKKFKGLYYCKDEDKT